MILVRSARSKCRGECQSIASAISDIPYPLIATKDRLITMLSQCYLDDSKDKNQDFLYVCAGFYGPAGAWKLFNKVWDKALKAENLAHYKTSELKTLTGGFAQFRVDPAPLGMQKAREAVERLKLVILKSDGLVPVGLVVLVDDHKAVMVHESANAIFTKDIYDRAFEGTLLKATELSCKSPRSKIAFVHDDGPDYERLRNLYESFRSANQKTGSRMVSFMPLDDTITPGLQIADLFANNIQNRTLRQIQHGDVAQEEVFMFHKARLFVWTKEFGELVLAGNLEKRGIQVPESLKGQLEEWKAIR